MAHTQETDPHLNPEMSRRDAIIKGGIAAAGLGAAIVYSGDAGHQAGRGLDVVADFFLEDPLGQSRDEVQLTPEELEAIREIESLDSEMSDFLDEMLEGLENEEEGEHLEHGPDKLDYIGTGVFAHGIKELSSGRTITQGHYYSQAVLIGLKRHNARKEGDEETLHHIDEELAATLKFTAIIEGTVVVAEGMMLDVETIYKEITARKDLVLQDRVAIVTELASVLAPMVTTVGASGMTTKEASTIVKQAQSFADQMVEDTLSSIAGESTASEDPATQESIGHIKALLQSHISDKAGFPFFGDPPFIATLERFGGIGLLWQSLSVGMVPALRSLEYTNKMITKELIKIGAIEGEEKDAGKLSREALGRNLGFVKGVMGRSVKNLVLPILGKEQDKNGMRHDVLGAFSDKVDGFKDLLLKDHIESHGHEEEGSRIEDFHRYDQFISGVLANLPDRSDQHSYDRIEMQREIKNFVAADDFEGLTNWMESHNLDATTARIFAVSAKEVSDEIEAELGFGGDVTSKWNPVAVYRRVTDVTRMQRALGHSFTDVLDVFPFQSMSMIFVSPVFKELVGKFDELTDKIPNKIVKDLINDFGKYVGIAGFSSVADNLVGVREGFKFTENNPSIALIAGIQGGMLLPPGNMANVVSFPLDEYGIEEAKKQILPIHARPLAEGFVWAQILGVADKLGPKFLKFPKPINATDQPAHGEEEAFGAEVGSTQSYSRRSLLTSLFG